MILCSYCYRMVRCHEFQSTHCITPSGYRWDSYLVLAGLKAENTFLSWRKRVNHVYTISNSVSENIFFLFLFLRLFLSLTLSTAISPLGTSRRIITSYYALFIEWNVDEIKKEAAQELFRYLHAGVRKKKIENFQRRWGILMRNNGQYFIKRKRKEKNVVWRVRWIFFTCRVCVCVR